MPATELSRGTKLHGHQLLNVSTSLEPVLEFYLKITHRCLLRIWGILVLPLANVGRIPHPTLYTRRGTLHQEVFLEALYPGPLAGQPLGSWQTVITIMKADNQQTADVPVLAHRSREQVAPDGEHSLSALLLVLLP